LDEVHIKFGAQKGFSVRSAVYSCSPNCYRFVTIALPWKTTFAATNPCHRRLIAPRVWLPACPPPRQAWTKALSPSPGLCPHF